MNVNAAPPSFDNTIDFEAWEGCAPPMNTPPNDTDVWLQTRYPLVAATVPESVMTMSGRYPEPAVADTASDPTVLPGSSGEPVEFS